MTDLDYFREALAAANMRYQILVSETTTIVVQGKRKQNPMMVTPVAIHFSPSGAFQNLHVQD